MCVCSGGGNERSEFSSGAGENQRPRLGGSAIHPLSFEYMAAHAISAVSNRGVCKAEEEYSGPYKGKGSLDYIFFS